GRPGGRLHAAGADRGAVGARPGPDRAREGARRKRPAGARRGAAARGRGGGVKAARPPAALALALLAALPGACKSGERPADRPAEKKEEAPPPPEDAAAMEVEREELSAEELPPPPPVPRAPRGLPPTPSPPHNPTTPARVELGRLLFFEPALSAGRAMACSTCHQPGLWNAAYRRDWGWDGGMPTRAAHILSHWKGQMGGQPDQVAAALGSSRGYAARFQRAFGAGGDPAAAEPSRERIAEALAAF